MVISLLFLKKSTVSSNKFLVIRFTAAIVAGIHAKNACQPWHGAAAPLPMYEDGFAQVFTSWCRLTDRYIVESTPIVQLFIDELVDSAAEAIDLMQAQMTPEDFFSKFINSEVSDFMTHEVLFMS